MRGYKSNYRGYYKPKFPEKWLEIPAKGIQYLSLWERHAFVFLEKNPNVLKVGAETVKIPYICATDGKEHTYMVDLQIFFKSGKKLLVEIKPDKQQVKPKKRGKKKITQIREEIVYYKNLSKWSYARKWCEENGYFFEIWGENKLRELGIMI